MEPFLALIFPISGAQFPVAPNAPGSPETFPVTPKADPTPTPPGPSVYGQA
jgi:hypothetical protein